MSEDLRTKSDWSRVRATALDKLLRLAATMPVGTRVLDLHSDDPARLLALARLGLDIYGMAADQETSRRLARGLRREGIPACAVGRIVRGASGGIRADLTCDWLVRIAPDNRQACLEALLEARARLKPGGWACVVHRAALVDGSGPIGERGKSDAEGYVPTGWAVASRPRTLIDGWTQAVYRRVDDGTPP